MNRNGWCRGMEESVTGSWGVDVDGVHRATRTSIASVSSWPRLGLIGAWKRFDKIVQGNHVMGFAEMRSISKSTLARCSPMCYKPLTPVRLQQI